MTTRILLVEDNERLASMLRDFLTSLGHLVTSAADGAPALAALQEGGIDLMILDLKLPGMSGVEVLQSVRRSPTLKALPVIIMTGVYRGEGYARAAGKLGVAAYLEKPFGKEKFLQAVASALVQAPAPKKFAESLVEYFHDRKSGTLELPGGTKVVILSGEPACFSSPGFLPFLVSNGHLSRTDLEQYPPEGPGRMPLTEAGLLSYDELLDQSRLFLSQCLLEAILQNHPTLLIPETFEIELPLTPISLPRLLHQAARTGADRFDLEIFLKQCGALYPVKTRQYYRLANLLSMGREEIELLEYLGHGSSVEGVLSSCGGPKSQGASFLHFLARMGMISLAPSPAADQDADFPQKRLFNRPIEEVVEASFEAMNFEDLVDEVSDSIGLVVGETGMAAPLSASEIDFEQDVQRDYVAIQDKNYYEMFSLTPGSFSFAGLKEAYFSKTRQYSPEKFMQLSGATLSRAQDVLSHYANAYNTLSNVVAKERYDEMLNANSIGVGGRQDDELQARIQFQSGKVFLQMEDYNSAERALQDAYNLDPQDAQTSAYLAWSIYKNPNNRGSHVAQEKCRMLLSKSLQMGRCAEAFAFRGWILLDEGRDGLAEGEFLKALRLSAQEHNAKAGMHIIRERREAEKKGLFKRIFG